MPANPAAALASARELQRRSEGAASKKDFGLAYQLAVAAWESVHQFPEDTACSNMAATLEKRLDELGAQANAQVDGSKLRTKTLIVK